VNANTNFDAIKAGLFFIKLSRTLWHSFAYVEHLTVMIALQPKVAVVGEVSFDDSVTDERESDGSSQ
jgi:hypothetical protein